MQNLSRWSYAAYAAPWFAVQVVALPLTNFVPGYYSSVLGLPLIAVSVIMLASRFFDIFTDPLIGVLSDRTRSPIGRRKPWIIAGAPILAAGAWMLFAPPQEVSPLYLFVAVSLAYLGFTLIQIPYVSWGAELSSDYDARSAIVAWREGVGVLGTLAAISTPLIASLLGYPGLGNAMFGVAVGVLVLLPLLLAPSLLFVREPKLVEAPKLEGGLREGLRAIAQNREFVWFAAAIFILFIGVAPGGAVGYLMMKHTFRAESLYPLLVFAEFVCMLVSVPFWAWAAKRFGKHRAMAVSLVWMCAFTSVVPILGGIDPELAVWANTARGLGFGAVFVIPYSLFADVIDVDTLRTGRVRSGLYFALAGMILKFALMLGIFVATAFPTLFGFEPSRPVNTPAAEFSVAISYAWITCVFWLAAAPLFWFFPLTRERQQALRAQIQAQAGAPAQ
jgi:glycoside/pentoside/hexuronide:cation symporter, GPH family